MNEKENLRNANSSEERICELSRELLRNFGYSPNSINDERGNLSSYHDFKNYGIDGLIYAKDLVRRDRLRLKKIKPSNKDGIYYSIDYRSNNFWNHDKANDNFIFAKLTELLPESLLNKKFLSSKKGKGYRKIKAILSKDNPDYNFYIKHNGNGFRNNLGIGALINAYFVPVAMLKDQVITNLNQIREEHELEHLNQGNVVDLILETHQTFKLYEANDNNYDFELINKKDIDPKLQPDLMMKIRKDYLPKYIKFDLNGEIEERKF